MSRYVFESPTGSKHLKLLVKYSDQYSAAYMTMIMMLLKLVYTEAAARGVLSKKVFLKMSENSQVNTCARVSFLIKLLALVLQLY